MNSESSHSVTPRMSESPEVVDAALRGAQRHVIEVVQRIVHHPTVRLVTELRVQNRRHQRGDTGVAAVDRVALGDVVVDPILVVLLVADFARHAVQLGEAEHLHRRLPIPLQGFDRMHRDVPIRDGPCQRHIVG